MNLIEYMTSHVLAFVLLCVLLGLIVGSFLNVVIHRLPLMMERDWNGQAEELPRAAAVQPDPRSSPVMLAPSHAAHRDDYVDPAQNLPLISHASLRRACGHCRERNSIRCQLVNLLPELLSAV